MRQAEVLLDHLLPIDVEVQWHGVQGYVDALGRQETLNPVHVLPYPENDSELQILLDGHHTAKATQIAGLVAVRANVITSDEELAAYVSAERPWWPQFQTMDELRVRYRDNWAVCMEHLGIVAIRDVPEVIHVQRSYRRPHDLRSVRVDRSGHPL